MAELVGDFGSTASGVSPRERGTGSDPYRLTTTTPHPPERVEEAPSIVESDEGFARVLLHVLVQEDFVPGRSEGGASLDPVPGTSPRARPNLAPDTIEQLPPGGIDLVRDQLAAELGAWERYAEDVSLMNDRALRQTAIDSLLDLIEEAFKTTPGPDLVTQDLVAVIQGLLSAALGSLLQGARSLGSALATGTDIVASILVNHVIEALAIEDLQGRHRALEKHILNDKELLATWRYKIYRIDTIDEYYRTWLERIPNSRLPEFRIPFSPEAHTKGELRRTLHHALADVGQASPGELNLDPLTLFAWLDHRGIGVGGEEDVIRLLHGWPIHARIRNLFRFLRFVQFPSESAPMAGDRIAPTDELSVSLYPQLVDGTKAEPEGILIVHLGTARPTLYLFSIDDYVDPPRARATEPGE